MATVGAMCITFSGVILATIAAKEILLSIGCADVVFNIDFRFKAGYSSFVADFVTGVAGFSLSESYSMNAENLDPFPTAIATTFSFSFSFSFLDFSCCFKRSCAFFTLLKAVFLVCARVQCVIVCPGR